MPWTTPVSEGDQLFCWDVGYPLRNLVDGINQKVQAIFPSSYPGAVDWVDTWHGPINVALGDDVHTLKLWNSYNFWNKSGGGSYVSSIDTVLFGSGNTGGFPGLINMFPDPTDPGVTYYGSSLTTKLFREAVGLPATKFYAADLFASEPPFGLISGNTNIYPNPHSTLLTGPYKPNALMRRKRHRRLSIVLNGFSPPFYSYATATKDDQANPAVAGQVAWDPGGGTWRCIASGNWVRDEDPTLTPDILDNTLDKPNTVSEYTFFHYSGASLRISGYWNDGQVQDGDILGPWVFEERRQLLNFMVAPGGYWYESVIP